MTTDLSQLYPQEDPQKDFSAKKSGYSTVYWIAAGVGTLVATGLAAFTSFKDAPDPPTGSAPAVLALAHSAQSESDSVAHAAFGDEREESPTSDELDLAEREGVGAADTPGAAAMPSPSALDDDPDAPEPDPKLGAPPTVDSLEQAKPGAYYVQLASYRTKETADAHAKALVSRGLPAQSLAYGGPAAGWWHAVRLGPFEDRVSAEKRRFELTSVDRRAAYVLPRSNGKFHVQVASFAQREEAERVAKSFNAEGHPTKVTRVKMSGSHWHCVRIGPFDTREEAVAYKALVPDVPGSQSTVIPFPPPPAQ